MERELTYEEISEMTLAIMNGEVVKSGFPEAEGRLRAQIAEILASGQEVTGFA